MARLTRLGVDVNLTDFRLLLNVVHGGSLTAGAELSHVSIAAASMRMRGMEDALGVKLLQRAGGRMRLTEAGQLVATQAAVLLGAVDELQADLGSWASSDAGRIRVYASTTAAREVLPPILKEFLSRHPRVSVELRERHSSETVRAVKEGRTDLGIISSIFDAEDLLTLPFRSDRLILIAATDHPLARRASVSFAEAAGYDIVGLAKPSAIGHLMQLAALEAKQPLRLRIQVGDLEAACAMVESNVGIAVVPQLSAARYEGRFRFRKIRLTDPWTLRDQKICLRRGGEPAPLVAELLALLRATAGGLAQMDFSSAQGRVQQMEP